MSNQEKLANPKLQALVDQGESLKTRILTLIENWPLDEQNIFCDLKKTSLDHQKKVKKLERDVLRWFNTIKIRILPQQIGNYEEYLPALVKETLQIISELPGPVCRTSDFIEEQRMRLIQEAIRTRLIKTMDEGIALIMTAPDDVPPSLSSAASESQVSHQPNTAFILMWMDPAKPDLDDVANTFKEVFNKFGIEALRADDVEHEDRITDVVLDKIRNSEFLIADLTGERPNVYYEIGFAHAIGKRPILYRKKGTPLHFDLSVHNVPEYENFTKLKDLLQKRLEAMTGRSSKENTP